MINVPKNCLILLIKGYREFISPLFPASCRYIPTCSEYSLEAIQRFGFLKGSILMIKRICRCRPGGSYGYDPVPDIYSDKKEKLG